MKIKYEIHRLNNAVGQGSDRKFVALRSQAPMTEEMMENEIQHACSLTAGDVRAVLSELRALAVRQLSQGSRFWIPGSGSLSLSAGLTKEAQQDGHKVMGRDIYARGILFRADHSLFKDVAGRAQFEAATDSTLSDDYTAEELWAKVDAYLTDHAFITRRDMRTEFGLSAHKTEQWLSQFMAEGKIVRRRSRRVDIFMKK